jgi:alpha-glucosidase
MKTYTRRDFVSLAIASPLFVSALPAIARASSPTVKISSPNGRVQVALIRDLYPVISLHFRNTYVLSARLGMTVDGVDIGRDIIINSAQRYKLNETYATRGVHSSARNRCNGARASITPADPKTKYTIEIRAYDDGIAFRYIIPGEGRRVPDELTTFRLGDVYAAWFHDFEGHYEGTHKRKEIWKIDDGEWLAPPVTMQLMDGAGYASITEASLVNYPGMGLHAARKDASLKAEFKVVLGHALPVSHPFDFVMERRSEASGRTGSDRRHNHDAVAGDHAWSRSKRAGQLRYHQQSVASAGRKDLCSGNTDRLG